MLYPLTNIVTKFDQNRLCRFGENGHFQFWPTPKIRMFEKLEKKKNLEFTHPTNVFQITHLFRLYSTDRKASIQKCIS